MVNSATLLPPWRISEPISPILDASPKNRHEILGFRFVWSNSVKCIFCFFLLSISFVHSGMVVPIRLVWRGGSKTHSNNSYIIKFLYLFYIYIHPLVWSCPQLCPCFPRQVAGIQHVCETCGMPGSPGHPKTRGIRDPPAGLKQNVWRVPKAVNRMDGL